MSLFYSGGKYRHLVRLLRVASTSSWRLQLQFSVTGSLFLMRAVAVSVSEILTAVALSCYMVPLFFVLLLKGCPDLVHLVISGLTKLTKLCLLQFNIF